MAKAFPAYSSTAALKPAKTSTDSNQVVFAGQTIAAVAGDLTLNALLGGIVVPKGAEIVYVMITSTDIDTNGTPLVTLSIGDTGDDDRLLTANTVGQAGGVVGPTIATTGFGYQYTAETTIQVKVKAIPATAAAGTITWGVGYVSN
jgi:hypothetical protein